MNFDQNKVKELNKKFNKLSPQKIIKESQNIFKNKIDFSTIATLYPQGTLAERLLSKLLADSQHPNDVTLAHDLIQEISNS